MNTNHYGVSTSFAIIRKQKKILKICRLFFYSRMKGSFSSDIPTPFDYILLTNENQELIKNSEFIINIKNEDGIGYLATFTVIKGF